MLRGDGSDPLLIETNTSTEYWQKGASLLTTDPLGTKDVALPDNSRAYMIAGTQHGGRAGATTDAGPNVNPRNPHNPMPAVRALLVALDEWVVSGKAPPPSRVPALSRRHPGRGRQDRLPGHPGRGDRARHQRGGAGGRLGEAQAPAERAYRTLVSRVDPDGNEVAGIRLPDIAVPLAAYTGWNEYKAPYPVGEIADRDGSYFAFPAGQDRPALQEPRRLRRQGAGSGRRADEGPAAAAGGCRPLPREGAQRSVA